MQKKFTLGLALIAICVAGSFPRSVSAEITESAAASSRYASSPERLKQGAQIYKQNCAVCHGKTGKADGPVASSFDVKPRDFSIGAFKYTKSDPERLKFIQEGKGNMPAWKNTLKEEQIKAVIVFIHTLKTKQTTN